MDTPRTVRVNEAGSEAASYRDAVDERRRVIHVRGSSPKRAYVLLGIAALVWIGVVLHVRLNDHLESGWFVFVGLASLAVLVQLGPPALWRAVQRSRFDLSRRELVVHTGLLGRRTRVEGWGVREPVVIERLAPWGKPVVRFVSWDLYAERDDGRRVHLATLHDEASVRYVTNALREGYRDAEQSGARHPFAVRFGPMPEGVTCEGDPDDLTSTWRLEARCPRGSLVTEWIASLGMVIGALVGTISVIGAGAVLIEIATRGRAIGVAIAIVPALFLVAIAVVVVRALRDQLRLTVLRSAGRVVLELAPSGVEITTTPWAVRPLPPRERRVPSAVRLRVTPLDRDPNEARIHVRHEGVEHRLHAPMLTDDARYLARVLEGYEPAERRSEGERSPQPRSATR
ncbi:MAG: hypothetical protein J0L92_12735 [Deltaproteobacteria bacterium]|nr:hypothetical protein [Deltaproteobacteria bacterium]